MSDKLRVLFSGPVGTRSGYGSHARDLVHALINMDKYHKMITIKKFFFNSNDEGCHVSKIATVFSHVSRAFSS